MDNIDSSLFLKDRGRVTGPYSVDQIAKMIKLRRLFRHNQLSPDGMQWVSAGELVPELFLDSGAIGRASLTRGRGLSDAAPAHEYDSSAPLELAGDDDLTFGIGPAGPAATHADVKKRTAPVVSSRYVTWAVSLLVTASALGMASVLVWRSLSRPLSDEVLAERVVLAVATGSPGDVYQSCGVMASPSLCIVPIEAAQYALIKIRRNVPENEDNWHTGVLKSADVLAGVAVVQVDIPKNEFVINVSSNMPQLEEGDEVRLLGGGRPGGEIFDGTVVKLMNNGMPDERFFIQVANGMSGLQEHEGRLLVSEADNAILGMVTSVVADGSGLLACTPVDALHNAWREARSLGPDDKLDPIDLLGADEKPTGDDVGGAGGGPSKSSPNEGGRDSSPSGETEMPPSEGNASGNGDVSPDTNHSGSDATDGDGEEVGGEAELGSVLRDIGGVVNDTVSEVTNQVAPDVTEDEAKEIGDEYRATIVREHGKSTDKNVVRRVTRLFQDVLAATKPSPGDFTLTVTRETTPNAFAFIGRNVVVTEGFVSAAGSDDEMILFALAHEVGHEVLGHTREPFRREKLAGGLLSIPGSVAETVLQRTVVNQPDELDADCFAVRTMKSLGRSPEGGVRFFQWLQSREEDAGDDVQSTDGVMSIFSSHPDHQARIAHIRHGCQ